MEKDVLRSLQASIGEAAWRRRNGTGGHGAHLECSSIFCISRTSVSSSAKWI